MLPKEMDVPCASDFLQHGFVKKNKRSSFFWIVKLFPDATPNEMGKIMDTWHKSATKVGIPAKDTVSIAVRSDHPGTDLGQLVLCFEGMLKLLGYDIA